MWIFTTHFLKFRAFRTLHFIKWYVFLKILIENKAFYFSKRTLHVDKACNKYLKKALLFKFFFIQSILLFFAKCLSKKCIKDNKSTLWVSRKGTCKCLFPTNWMTFVRCSKNKAELFPYLSNVVVKETQDKVVGSTVNESVITNRAGLEISSLMSCDMEEADERIFVNVKHALREHSRIMIKAVDGNVVVLAITNFHQLVLFNKLWIEFGAENC